MERSADKRIHTTEWEDIQYKYGNRVGKYSTHELEILAQKLADQNEDACLETYDPNRERVADKLARGGYDRATDPDEESADKEGRPAPDSSSAVQDIVDSDDEDSALAAIRQRRLQELMRAKQNERFGTLREVPGGNYVEEVTEASARNWVVAVLVKPGNSDCEALLSVMRTCAQRHRAVKFVSMVSVDAIKNFPDKHIPCVLLYRNKELKKQFTNLDPWKNGHEFGVATVEKVLRAHKVISSGDSGSDEDGEPE